MVVDRAILDTNEQDPTHFIYSLGGIDLATQLLGHANHQRYVELRSWIDHDGFWTALYQALLVETQNLGFCVHLYVLAVSERHLSFFLVFLLYHNLHDSLFGR